MEFENLIEKIKRRREEGDFKTAAKICDKIPWDEVDDINILMFAASVYEEAECFRDAKTILDYAYEIAPVKNRLYYALAYINIKCKELKEGIGYYIDFYNAFPEDNRKLILKYEILKAKGAPLDQQKRILSEYIKEEKDERMTYELALICDKLGEEKEVITCCDFIVQFFGIKQNGFGKDALLLKKKYTPLTKNEIELLNNTKIDGIPSNKILSPEVSYSEPPKIYNRIRLEEEKKNIPVEKIERIDNLEEEMKIENLRERKEELLNEKEVNSTHKISYRQDIESYQEKDKKEEGDMKLKDTKLHMVIEAHSNEEGIDIAKKELGYIHDVFGEKVPLAKASAYNINEKGFSYYVDKIRSKDLIIESAGQLKAKVIDEIEEYMINKRGKTIFALVDMINNFDNLATDRPSFIRRFDVFSVLSNRPQETLDVTRDEKEAYKADRDANTVERIIRKEPVNIDLSPEEFVNKCKEYVKSIDCVLEKNAIPMIYERIDDMKENKIPLTKDNAIALIEEAADRAERPKMFKKPNYDKDGCLILSEEHFVF